MKDIHSLYLDEILVNIGDLSSTTIHLFDNYFRHKIVYCDNIVIDRAIKDTNINGGDIEGEEIEYFIDQLSYHNNESSEIQSMGC